MKCWPLDLRHLQRDSDFSAGFGKNGDPAYTLTSAQTGGGNIPAVATAEVFPLDLRNALRDADREGRTGVGFGDAGDPANTVTQGAVPAVAFAQNQRNEVRQMDVVGALATEPGMKQTAYIAQERERERERKWTIRSTLCAASRPWKRSVCRPFQTDIRPSNTTESQLQIRSATRCLATR